MMRKKFKKILLTIIIATLCIVSESGISVFASDVEHYDDIATECDINLPENTDDTHEYWEFTGSNMRMGSDGSFTFSYQRSMQSCTFKELSTDSTYYLYFTKPLTSTAKITGSGRIETIQ